jgi:uncharacterized phage protein (TIGR01671 family)
MRKIKFRSWDVREEKMLGWDIVQNQYFYTIEQYPDYKVMQYTGFEDKNGNEIYEGDIIMYNEGSTESRSKMEVKWCDASFQLKAYKENWCYDIGECLQSTLVVIGNIYENPELL